MKNKRTIILFISGFIIVALLIFIMSSMAQRKIYVRPGSAAKPGQHKWALIIGINNYMEPITDLDYAVSDAQSVYSVLVDSESGGFEKNKVKLLTDNSGKRPTRRNILKALKIIESVADYDDTVFIFFSGHGIEEGGISYFLPIDADVSILADTGIPMERFTKTLNRTKAKVQVMFFDACHSGARKDKSDSGRMSSNAFSRIFTEAEGRAILSSCGVNEVSWEYPEKGYGVFTYYLMSALKGKADLNGDDFVTVSETSNYVTEKVKEWSFKTGKKQNPRLDYNVSGQIVLTLSRGEEIVWEKDGAEMVLIPAGEFEMGDHHGVGHDDEKPVHTVYTDAFYMDKYEVTNAQYAKFLNDYGENEDSDGHELIDFEDEDCLIGKSGSSYRPKSGYENHPVIEVSWYGANAYAEYYGKRLPTEAEWEKAARGGLKGKKYPWGDSLSHDNANYSGTGGKDQWSSTSPVGSFDANGYGLYDMAGNVWEWCADWYDEDYYSSSPRKNPLGPSSGGSFRVLRGGSWYDYDRIMRASYRYYFNPNFTLNNIGFRGCVSQDLTP